MKNRRKSSIKDTVDFRNFGLLLQILLIPIFLASTISLIKDKFFSKNVAIVVPVVVGKLSQSKEAMESWIAGCHAWSTNKPDLVFITNNLDNVSQRLVHEALKSSLGSNEGCFGRVKTITAGLSQAEDRYPVGPSLMFYSALDQLYAMKYDAFFWMEHDVVPVKKRWISKVVDIMNAQGEFAVLGALPRGDKIYKRYLRAEGDHHWLSHINGAAIYSTSEDMRNLALVAQNRIDKSFAWDVAIGMALNRWFFTGTAEDWDMFLHYAPLYRYSDFILNYIGTEQIPDTSHLPHVIFIHGNKNSFGNKF